MTNSSRLDIFGFTHMPFITLSKSPYLDDLRKDAIDKLNNFLDHRGFAVITAPPGCGKTILLHHLTEKLHPNAHKIIYIPFSILSEIDMLRTLCYELELEPKVSKSVMLRNIQNRIKDIHPVNTILVLDEIQKINHQTLEMIRLTSNFNFDGKNYFSIIMAGTEQFLQQLRLKINEPLRQRTTLFIRLCPFSRTHTAHYIQHQLRQAGAHQDILSEQAANSIHDQTSGIPRIINNLTLTALQEAAMEKSPTLQLGHVQKASKIALIPEREIQT